MKLYKHITRFQFRRLVNRRMYRELVWAKSLRSGDIVHTCRAFNVRVKSIKSQKQSTAYWLGKNNLKRNGWFINEFVIVDEHDCWHYTGSCAWPKQSREQIEAYWAVFESSYDFGYVESIQNVLRNGGHICDEDGIILPEIDKLIQDSKSKSV